jgi:ATP-dependent Zn protease
MTVHENSHQFQVTSLENNEEAVTQLRRWQTPRRGRPPRQTECYNFLSNISDWIPFFWQTAVFWVHLMRSGSNNANNYGGGGTNYRVAEEGGGSCHLMKRHNLSALGTHRGDNH